MKVCDFDKYTNPKYIYIKEDKFNYHVILIDKLIEFSKIKQNILKFEEVKTEILFSQVSFVVNNIWRNKLYMHLKRCKNADLNFPIIIYRDNIVDGIHRVVKAHISGIESMKVVYLNALPGIDLIKK